MKKIFLGKNKNNKNIYFDIDTKTYFVENNGNVGQYTETTENAFSC